MIGLNDGDVRGFHYRDGLYFYRQRDGAVRVEKGDILIAIIDPHSWASVVASMTAGGEDQASYEAMREFHDFDHTKV